MPRALLALLVGALLLSACAADQPKLVRTAPFDVDEPEPDPEPDPEPEELEEPEEPEVEQPEDDRPRSHLTGEPIDEELLDQPQLLVKIENSPQARPQAGLDDADIVYEEVVEGGVTRFVAIFHSQVPDVAGPIRSARPVTAQLMRGYGPSGFAYSGARQEVENLLAHTPSIRITEGGAGFFRDHGRAAPHNLYVETQATLDGAIARGAEPFTDVGWTFEEERKSREDVPGRVRCPEGDAACDDPGVAVDVRMSREFTSNWEYDADDRRYRRGQNGRTFRVTGEGQIGAANVVVLETRHYIGASGYPETDVVTEGADAVVLRDGRRYDARWSKPTADDPIELFTVDGDPFPLAPGPTWVHLPDRLPAPDA